MMLRHRALLRAGVAAAAVVAAATAFAAPAFADDTADLGVKLQGTTIAPGTDGKYASVSLSNAGPNDAHGILVTIDVSMLDMTKVELLGGACGEPENGKILCGLTSDTITSGAEYDLEFPLKKKAGATGKAGTVTVSIEHEGTDLNSDNNVSTSEVVVSEDSGADLRVWAHDVYGFDADAEEFTGEPVAPGGQSFVNVQVLNYGDRIAKGVAVKLSLPEHVTLTEPEPECDFSADKRVATCDYTDIELQPWGFNPGGAVNSFFWAVQVDEDAPAPATLHGTVTAAAIEEVDVEVPAAALRNAPKAAELPENFKDVDKSDNTDEFGVFVAVPGGSGGGLPVTGPAAGIIGGVGGAVVIAGLVLFFVARRRRIITVTPDA
ncbi:MAG TPA: hypothetical protein VK659_16720 [Asanoa sp.]|nr:hypothetical protein [Asanoa sp.]